MIEFQNVSMTYASNATKALRGVSFTIQRGEFVFIIGESGSGKSTVIRLLTGEARPTEGKVTVSNRDMSRIRRRQLPKLRRRIGMVFQDFRLIPSKTVYENVAFAMEIIGTSSRTIRKTVPMMLSSVGIYGKASSFPRELSGGEQQRASIARAMVNNPELILADEPTGNLDPANSESIMSLLNESNATGTTVVICTHDRSLVDQMQKRVIEIRDGLLIRDVQSGQYVDTVPDGGFVDGRGQ